MQRHKVTISLLLSELRAHAEATVGTRTRFEDRVQEEPRAPEPDLDLFPRDKVRGGIHPPPPPSKGSMRTVLVAQ